MSVASKLLGTPSHEELAEVRQQAQVKASEDAKRIRELERQLRDKEGQSEDRGRALVDASRRIKELEDGAKAADTGLRQRDWQMEQQRERARQAMAVLKDITAPVQTEATPLQGTGEAVTVPNGTDIRSLPQNAPEPQP